MKPSRALWASILASLVSMSGTYARDGATLASLASDIMQNRCMVCHGCYDAPCQLKLEARAGLERGASKALVYDGGRLRAAEPTRLFDDAKTEQGWRNKGFFPVLGSGDPGAGLIYRMLELKQQHPLPAGGSMSDSFDLALDRDQQCPRQEEFDSFATDYPLWGMPYALPGLTGDEHQTMLNWLAAGAPAVPVAPLVEGELASVRQWETFLNGASNKQRLMARYLFEHLFLANIYFGGSGHPNWFRIVRSRTAPGEPIDLIATRRPFDEPGEKQFYYRIQRMPVQPLVKIHMPYRLDAARMERYRRLFLEPGYEVTSVPDYSAEMAVNPFKTFQDIPAISRYRFLLDEARFTIMNFIKGPVCRGQVALDVIDDQFWVMFAEPENIDAGLDGAFLAQEMDNLRLPTVETGTPVDLVAWHHYSRAEQRYQKARADYLRRQLEKKHLKLGLDAIWDGDGNNPNAALTVFRHFDSGSVVQGFVGDVPKTAWLIDYPLLERIHYLLVANFDVFGPVSHQLASRLYMDFLRFEGENNFLGFMPAAARRELRTYWYRDAPHQVGRYMAENNALHTRELEYAFETNDPKRELLLVLKNRLHGANAHRWDYRETAGENVRSVFEGMEADVGSHNSFLHHVSFLNVIGEQRDEVYTIIRNAGHSNIAHIFEEKERRLPEEDSLTVVKGILGAYPNYFFMVNEKELASFAKHIASLSSAEDYKALLDRWGVHRNDPWFWRVSDKFHRVLQTGDPVEAGLLDYNRYHAR